MEIYHIIHCETMPDWDRVPALEAGNIEWTEDFGIRMTQKICYSEENLFVQQTAIERLIRAEHHEMPAAVCEDSCMEFFLVPEGDTRYLNFEWNWNGCLHLDIHAADGSGIGLLPKEHRTLFAFRSSLIENGWQISYRIPLSFLQVFYPTLAFQPGTAFRANCYKCGDLTEHPHFLAWSKNSSETPNFHCLEDFGRMLLV